MITSYFKGHCPPWNPELDVTTGIYLLVSVFSGRGGLVILYVFVGGVPTCKVSAVCIALTRTKKRNTSRKPQKVKRALKRLTHKELGQSLVAGFDGTASVLRLTFAEAKLEGTNKRTGC
jgi:hypothetical protein